MSAKRANTAKSFSGAIAAFVAVLLVLKIALPTAVLAVAAERAGSGTVLVPICAGGVVQYVEIDLTAGEPEEENSPSQEAAVAVVDCAIFGAFTLTSTSAKATSLAAAAHAIAWPALERHSATASRFARPPTRGPPSPS